MRQVAQKAAAARIPALVLALMLAAAPAARAQEATADAAGIEAVIADQISDFLSGDVAGAFDHASPMIQGIFGTSENFGMMVRNGYPMVWAPQSHSFLDLRDEDGRLRQRVAVEDGEGRRFLLDYDMIRTERGWKINGVTVIPAPEVAV